MNKDFASTLLEVAEDMDIVMDSQSNQEHIPYAGEHVRGVIAENPILKDKIPNLTRT